jgi:non-specific serine/threonine protein kinase/serine/threonine-protein kinase
MAASRRERVDELLRSTLQLPASERESFLAESCGEDLMLKSEVESLIRQRSAGVASTVMVDASEHAPTDDSESLVGQRIGAHRIVRELGRGGMGTVYLAVRDDDEFQRRVAIKVIKLGLDSDEIRRRFRTERQILASLDHPNIARLLDGGTTDDGVSYFVMEYVDGTPIDAFCDGRRLRVAERLQLFRTVCSAVHAAHQNLVVHRDIKPGNILVTSDGTPKLLDFGIAKLLNPELANATLAPTAEGVRPMTPTYASPEQLRGEPVTTASDIYSLGVLLYFLLTGRRPYQLRALTPREIERVVHDEAPGRPSDSLDRADGEPAEASVTAATVSHARDVQPDKLRRQLRGDLDTIVLMALRKEPHRRYASADAFSEDIKRHLDGLPVAARPDSLGYRASKFVRRYRGGVAAAGLGILSLLVAVVATTRSARIAQREQARAEARFNDVRGLATSALLEVHDAIADLPGSTQARRLLVTRALAYLDRLAADSSGDPGLARELAVAYERVGDVQGNPYDANLGDVTGALASYQAALGIRQRLAARDSSAPARAELAAAHERVADVLLVSGDVTAAHDHARVALGLREALARDGPLAGTTDARRGLARATEQVADALRETGDYAGALAAQRNAMSIREDVSRLPDASVGDRRSLGTVYEKLGRIFALMDSGAAAREYAGRALALHEAIAAQEPATRTSRRELGVTYVALGDLLSDAGDFAAAIVRYRQSLDIRRPLLDADPFNVQARRDFAVSSANVGLALARTGVRPEALEHLRRATDIFQQLAVEQTANTMARIDLSKTHHAAGAALMALGDAAGALERFEQGITISESVASTSPVRAVAQRDLANRYFQAAEANERLGQWSAARERYRQSEQAWLAIQQLMPQAVPPGRIDEVRRAAARTDSALARKERR